MPDNNNDINKFRRVSTESGEKTKECREDVKISKSGAKWMSRMVKEVNKFPYSNSKVVGLYVFDWNELEWYYKEIRQLADKVLDLLECPICEDTIKTAVIPGCGCDNVLACCSKCWVDAGSTCCNCKRNCTVLPFEAVDDIILQCHIFFQEKAFKKDMKFKENDLKRIYESYHQVLKQSEMQLMCNYCFGTLENTMLVKLGSADDQTLSQVCTGCHELYMDSYKCTEVSPYPTFDTLTHEFHQFFLRILSYCTQHKVQAYKDPYPDMKQPSYFKQRVIERRGSYKTKLFGLCKKAIVVGACAYLVAYYMQLK